MGLNRRNARILQENRPDAIRLVNDKHATKQALAAAGAPTAPTELLVRSRREMDGIRWQELPESWAVKPNQSLGGNGILLATTRTRDGWSSPSGRQLTVRSVQAHLGRILDGEFSPRDCDWAMFEPLIRPDPALERLSCRGLPDIRVICIGDEPRLAMLRLPTRASGGRANLHQNAVGAAVDLDIGRITAASFKTKHIDLHPDTGHPISGECIPHWARVLDAASRCASATGLRYLGADIVIDHIRGPLILEVNARPGLEIQNITGRGLNQVTER